MFVVLFLILALLLKYDAVDSLLMIDQDDPMNAHFPNILDNKVVPVPLFDSNLDSPINAHFPNILNNRVVPVPLSDSKPNKAAELLINPSRKTQVYPKGKEIGLTCEGRAEGTGRFADLKWFGPKGELVEGRSGSVEVYRRGYTLHLMFKEPTAEDSGMYNCTAVHYTIEKMHTNVELIFYHDITWDDCPTEQILTINTDGKIKCKVSANPPPTISWKKDGLTLPEWYVTEYDGIKISDVNENDNGNFTVSATVPRTGIFRSRIIKVKVHASNQAEGGIIPDETQNQAAGKSFSYTLWLLIVECAILQLFLMELKDYMLV